MPPTSLTPSPPLPLKTISHKSPCFPGKLKFCTVSLNLQGGTHCYWASFHWNSVNSSEQLFFHRPRAISSVISTDSVWCLILTIDKCLPPGSHRDIKDTTDLLWCSFLTKISATVKSYSRKTGTAHKVDNRVLNTLLGWGFATYPLDTGRKLNGLRRGRTAFYNGKLKVWCFSKYCYSAEAK